MRHDENSSSSHLSIQRQVRLSASDASAKLWVMPNRLFEKIKKLLRKYLDCSASECNNDDSTYGGLLGLPIEILYYILEFLPGPSVLALCVTSKVLYHTCSHVRQSLNSDALVKKQFLWLLDRDTPHLLHCRDCNKLFKWTSTGRTFGCPRDDMMLSTSYHSSRITISAHHHI